jgi:hypothetical protein
MEPKAPLKVKGVRTPGYSYLVPAYKLIARILTTLHTCSPRIIHHDSQVGHPTLSAVVDSRVSVLKQSLRFTGRLLAAEVQPSFHLNCLYRLACSWHSPREKLRVLFRAQVRACTRRYFCPQFNFFSSLFSIFAHRPQQQAFSQHQINLKITKPQCHLWDAP